MTQSITNFSDFATNNANSYYLHPSESPSAALVTPALEGTKNFQPWIRSMHIGLISKNKISFVDGTFLAPAKTDALYNQWLRCNSMVLSWIQRSVSPSLQKSIAYFDRAYDAWRDLHDRFDQGDIFRIADLQEDICRLSQGNLSVSDFYTELKSLWGELENFRPMLTCKCAIPCTCDAMKSTRKYRDQNYTIRFLKGLNEQYAHVCSQIMMMDPFPIISKAFSMVIQQERQLEAPIATDIDNNRNNTTNNVSAQANAANTTTGSQFQSRRGGFSGGRNRGRGSPGGRSQGGTRVCTNCGKNNHTVESCFFIHEFPPGYQTKNTNSSVNNAASNSSGNNSHSEEDKTASADSKANISLSAEQYQGLLELLQASKLQATSGSHSANTAIVPYHTANSVTACNAQPPDNSGKVYVYCKELDMWIVDTGATDHITHNLNLLSNCFFIKPIYISLPNNTTAIATLAGSIHFSNGLSMHNVLYVPNFHANLMSGPQLAKSSKCTAYFDESSLSIVQADTGRNIGIASLIRGLY